MKMDHMAIAGLVTIDKGGLLILHIISPRSSFTNIPTQEFIVYFLLPTSSFRF